MNLIKIILNTYGKQQNADKSFNILDFLTKDKLAGCRSFKKKKINRTQAFGNVR